MIPRLPLSVQRSTRQPPRTAGSACRTIALSTPWVACGLRPTATRRRRPVAPTAFGRWRPRGRHAPPRSCSSAYRRAPKCAVRSSRPTSRPSSSPCSIRAKPTRTIRRPRRRRSRARRPAGPTSSPTCRHGRRWSRSRRRAAARSASDRRLGVPDRLRVGAHQGADELLVTGEDRHHVDRCDASLPDDASALHHGIAGRQRRAEHQRRQRIPVGAGELHG